MNLISIVHDVSHRTSHWLLFLHAPHLALAHDIILLLTEVLFISSSVIMQTVLGSLSEILDSIFVLILLYCVSSFYELSGLQ